MEPDPRPPLCGSHPRTPDLNTQTFTLSPTLTLTVTDDPAITKEDGDLQALLHQDGTVLVGWLGYVDDANEALTFAARHFADMDLADEVFSTEDGSERYLRFGTWAMTANTMGGSFEQADCSTIEAAHAKFAEWRKGTLDAIAEAQAEVADV